MDAARVGDRSKAAPEVAEDITNKEAFWKSSYLDSQERWTKDMKECGYESFGTYEVSDKLTLYRFETKRTDAPKFQNVLILKT